MWDPSSSPEENWSDEEGGNEYGEWPIKGIVGEEVNGKGESRYELRWQDWTRVDGTNTTWTSNLHDNPAIHKQWTKSQKKLVDKIVSEGCDVNIRKIAGLDVHNVETRLKAMGYADMIRKRNGDTRGIGRGRGRGHGSGSQVVGRGAMLDQEFERLRAEKEREAETGEVSARLRKPRRENAKRFGETGASASGSNGRGTHSVANAVSSRTRSIQGPGPSSAGDASPSFSPTSTLRGMRPQSRSFTTSSAGGASTSTGSSYSIFRSSPPPKPKIRVEGPLRPRREGLENHWNKAARKAGAARLKIVNHVDPDDAPVTDEFVYTEQKYIYADGVPRLQSSDCFVTCDCTACEDASGCKCQDPSELEDVRGVKEWAYDSNGLFAFNLPPGVEVVECNKYCACPPTCRNRVAQQPRDVPIEIFKTVNRGWGARAEIDIVGGKVVGVYTGLLVRREVAERSKVKDYCFDLDGKEDGDEEGEDMYSVDSSTCGNWTRFINHSCEPNMRVYSVVYDTIPEMNTPYLAFVALEDIPAYTELTFDYDPAAGRAAAKGKGKGRGKGKEVPAGARVCMCGHNSCRGWVSV